MQNDTDDYCTECERDAPKHYDTCSQYKPSRDDR
jgi:hypothetical protein